MRTAKITFNDGVTETVSFPADQFETFVNGLNFTTIDKLDISPLE